MVPIIDIDVVIPVRDVDRYLAETLDTVLQQGGVECAVVVVDAGSVQPVELEARHAEHPRIRLVRSPEPLTCGGARNVGVALGSASWLTFVDADDLWPEQSRAQLLAACERASAELAAGMITNFGSLADAAALVIPDGKRRALVAGGVVVARSAWDAVGGFDPKLNAGEFLDWYNRFVISGRPSTQIDDVVLQRRIHQESTTAKQARQGARDDYLEVVRRWMRQKPS